MNNANKKMIFIGACMLIAAMTLLTFKPQLTYAEDNASGCVNNPDYGIEDLILSNENYIAQYITVECEATVLVVFNMKTSELKSFPYQDIEGFIWIEGTNSIVLAASDHCGGHPGIYRWDVKTGKIVCLVTDTAMESGSFSLSGISEDQKKIYFFVEKNIGTDQKTKYESKLYELQLDTRKVRECSE